MKTFHKVRMDYINTLMNIVTNEWNVVEIDIAGKFHIPRLHG